MMRFLLTFFAVYLTAHAFFYYRVRALLPQRWPAHLMLILFLVLMVLAPISARLLERSDHYLSAHITAYVGYTWMGFLFYAFLLFLLVSVVGISNWLVNALFRLSLPTFSGKGTTAIVLGVTIAISVYGFFEAKSLRVERIAIKTGKLPAGVERIRVGLLSDVHLGLIVREERMEAILDKVLAENPDILVSAGDLVDGDIDRIERLPAIFNRIQPRFGKYAVTGNHEFYAGLERSMRAEREYGFTVLRGEAKTIGGVINIVGVDDPAVNSDFDEHALLNRAQNGLFTLLLKHRPDPRQESLGMFDLQLSGHTHYGQLFPFRYFSQLVYPYQNGPYYLDKGSVLYTSRGSATWGPPMRVLAPPEVTIVDIVRE